MNRPSSTDSRLIAWLEDGPTSGPDDALADALARVRSTRQRPGWLDRLTGDTMDTTLRARPVPVARLMFALLITLLVLALTVGAAIVGSQVIRLMGPDRGPDVLRAALPPTACPNGTTLVSGDIATIAGTGLRGHSGDDGAAISAQIDTNYSGGLAVDPTGTVYLADTGNRVIRRIGLDGRITVFAGTGNTGFAGDNGRAADAVLTAPTGLTFDDVGSLLFADSGRIRRIDPQGTITTVAGVGTTIASAGNDAPALTAQINAGQLAIGPDGSIYLDDTNNFRRIGPDGIIHAFAGTGVAGYSGDRGQALDAQFGEVNGAAADAKGNVYLGDAGGHRIRMVDPAGIITTIAGTGQAGSTGDDGLATKATFGYPGSMVLDPAGDLYVSDWDQNVVRVIGTDGIIRKVAGGNGATGPTGDCGPATSAVLSFPTSLAFRDGALYIMDSNDYRVRVVVP